MYRESRAAVDGSERAPGVAGSQTGSVEPAATRGLHSRVFFAACPLCERHDPEPWSDRGGIAFARCPGCSLVYKTLAPPADEGYYDTEYRSGRKDHRRERFEHRVRKAMRQLRAGLAVLPSARSAIDVGCSYGYAIEAGRRLGLRTAGVDLSAHAVAANLERGLDARVGSTDAIPAADGEFDLMLMKHVLEHSPSPSTALAEARRVLGQRGVLLIAVPDVDYLRASIARGEHKYFSPEHHGREHHIYYSRRTLPQMLQKHGFTVRATSKAVHLASSGSLQSLAEPARFAAVWAWQALAEVTHLRRELFAIAQPR